MNAIFIIGLTLAGLLYLSARDQRKPRVPWRLKYRLDGEAQSQEVTELAVHRRDAVNTLALRLGREHPGKISIITDVEMERTVNAKMD